MNLRSIRVRLLTMTSLLSLGFAAYLLGALATDYRALQESSRILAVSEVAVATSDLVHELQKERGLSAGFIASQGKKFADPLLAQRKLTDERVQALRKAQAERPPLPERFAEHLKAAADFSNQLAHTRTRVSNQSLSGGESFDLYTRVIDLNLAAVTSVAATLSNADITRRFVAYNGLIQAKEYVGRERATLNAAFSADLPLSDAIVHRLIAIATNQATHLETFRAISPDVEVVHALDATLGSDFAKNAAAMRRVALESASKGNFGIAPTEWATTITRKIEAMKGLEDRLAAQTIGAAEAVRQQARRGIALASGAALVVVLVALLFARLLVRMLRDLRAITRSAQSLAQGDLGSSVTVNRRDEIGELQGALAQTVNQLAQIIGEVCSAADQLSNAAGQVSATAQSLSQSSSEQAASVEETTSSMEQMTASIAQNTKNARVTDAMAAKSAKEAAEGGAAVTRTVDDMKSIAGKIGIIDDIAYQTNLLALNAAIEAARAGEHGKGFAVVAAEVRKLAERSQVAAQEIGNLATSSVEQAERAGALLGEMVPSIRKTSDLVQEIAVASQEQSSGVAQINDAMGQLNRATQQNASASEELAATAEELGSQAEQLQQTMTFFRLA